LRAALRLKHWPNATGSQRNLWQAGFSGIGGMESPGRRSDMTHPNVKPESPVPAIPGVDHPCPRAPGSSASDVRPALALPATAEARAAANDDAADTPEEIRNPLWIIAIGMACFFGAAALVMALG
jgi:hypothetical protein